MSEMDHAEYRNHEMQDYIDKLTSLVAELVEWVDHPDTRRVFFTAAIHGCTCSQADADQGQDLWDRAREIAKEAR